MGYLIITAGPFYRIWDTVHDRAFGQILKDFGEANIICDFLNNVKICK